MSYGVLNSAHLCVGIIWPIAMGQGAKSTVGIVCFVYFWHNSPQWARASSFTRFLDHTQRRTTFGRTPLDEWSARRTDLCLTTHNTHNRHTCPRLDSNPQSQQASGLTPQGHRDRRRWVLGTLIYIGAKLERRGRLVWTNLYVHPFPNSPIPLSNFYLPLQLSSQNNTILRRKK